MAICPEKVKSSIMVSAISNGGEILANEMVLSDKQGGVGIITLNRPERLNAYDRAFVMEMEEVLTRFENDDDVKVVIITGAGEKAFSAGADIHEMRGHSEADTEKRNTTIHDWHWHLASYRKPLIGAINGLAYGGGAVIASAFDIRIGCERSSFRFLAVAYGRLNSTWSLPMVVGWPMTKELLFTARVVEAEEALRIGLLNRLVPSSELMKVSLEMGQTIAANNPMMVQGAKDIMIRNVGLGWREMLQNEQQTISESLEIPPADVSFKDFLERKGK